MERRKVATLTVLKREEAFQVQQENIKAAGMLGGIVRTCIGPRAMVKMVLTRNGSIEVTNDGNSVLREIEVTHPVIKSLIELSRTQSEEVGDGTTSVVILAAEILTNTLDLLKQKMHPIKICGALKRALDISLGTIKNKAVPVGSIKEKGKTRKEIEKEIIRESISTKISHYLLPLETLAYEAMEIVTRDGRKPDIKRCVRVEKIPGGKVEESKVFDGIVIQKDVIDAMMKKRIENPSVLLIDFPLEYRKGENQAHIEMFSKESFTRALEVEEEQIEKMVQSLIDVHPSVIISEKGISDHASALLKKNGITAIRRVKKSDLQRISLATGAHIVSQARDATVKAKGSAGLFSVEQIGDEPWMKLIKCSSPKACTLVLRGPSREILGELERNLQDALAVARNLLLSPSVVPGGGAIEMCMARALDESVGSSEEKKVFSAVASALRTIPALLLTNSGASRIRASLLELQSVHASGKSSHGVNGVSGSIGPACVHESSLVKEQAIKSAIEGAIIVLRVDGVVKQ